MPNVKDMAAKYEAMIAGQSGNLTKVKAKKKGKKKKSKRAKDPLTQVGPKDDLVKTRTEGELTDQLEDVSPYAKPTWAPITVDDLVLLQTVMMTDVGPKITDPRAALALTMVAQLVDPIAELDIIRAEEDVQVTLAEAGIGRVDNVGLSARRMGVYTRLFHMLSTLAPLLGPCPTMTTANMLAERALELSALNQARMTS